MKHRSITTILSEYEIETKLSKRAIRLINQYYHTVNNSLATTTEAEVIYYADKTVALLRNSAKDLLGIGWALRGKKDKPNTDIGLRVALGRAVLHMIYPHEKDNCTICHGIKGGVKGNEIKDNGKLICDYCHADMLAKEK
jgi:predicted CXXCH cytochrome family protein